MSPHRDLPDPRRRAWRRQGPAAAGLTALLFTLGLAAVGVLDVLSGVNVHLFSLYFMPLAWAAARLGLPGAACASVVTTAAWLLVQTSTDMRYAAAQVWLVDFFTQGAGFLAVGLLCARLSEVLHRERASNPHDPWTGLRKRAAFLDHAQGALSSCRRHRRPVALVCVQLDFGRRDGPGATPVAEVLRRCAQRLQWSLRASDVLGRVGDHAFGVLMSEAGDEQAACLLERIRTALDGGSLLQDSGVVLHIGVTTDPVGQSDARDLLQLAESQLLQGRQAGLQDVCVTVAADAESAWPRRSQEAA
jgi:diguanylate cyclase (GGDEF)-like protein